MSAIELFDRVAVERRDVVADQLKVQHAIQIGAPGDQPMSTSQKIARVNGSRIIYVNAIHSFVMARFVFLIAVPISFAFLFCLLEDWFGSVLGQSMKWGVNA